MYALVLDDTIQSVGHLPTAARRIDTGQWVTPPNGAWTAEQAADCGYLRVVDVSRPDDTDTQTSTHSVELLAGVPTVVWTTRNWTPEELASHELAVAQADLDRAVLVASAPTELAAVQQLTLQTQGISDGASWRQPTGAHDAYPVGYTVTHADKTWENLTPANVWEPGVSGWREVVAEGYPAWVQPTGAQDAYNIGDRVSFEGTDYESVIDANVWSPTGYPAGWTVV